MMQYEPRLGVRLTAYVIRVFVSQHLDPEMLVEWIAPFVSACLQPGNFDRPSRFFQGLKGLVFESICYVILVLFCGFFRCCRRFGVFFELVYHSDCIRQKGNAVPTKTGVRFFGREKQITSSQSTCIRNDLLFRSFAIARFY